MKPSTLPLPFFLLCLSLLLLVFLALQSTTSSNGSSQSHHNYDHDDDDESQPPSQLCIFSFGKDIALGAHEGHYYLFPNAFDIEDGVTLLKHYLHHQDGQALLITSWFRIQDIPSNLVPSHTILTLISVGLAK